MGYKAFPSFNKNKNPRQFDGDLLHPNHQSM
nr:MAG TPA: hypothetical protein [Caudoviricetes sp.]